MFAFVRYVQYAVQVVTLVLALKRKPEPKVSRDLTRIVRAIKEFK